MDSKVLSWDESFNATSHEGHWLHNLDEEMDSRPGRRRPGALPGLSGACQLRTRHGVKMTSVDATYAGGCGPFEW